MADGGSRLTFEAFRHEALAEVGSTNSECLARARGGDPGLLWLTATRQLAGRGRRGRAWTSEPGNLYASLLLIDPAGPDHWENIGSLPLAVAVAVHAALRSVLPPDSAPIEVKWPNDILIGRRKTCGILLESESLPDGRRALVIGIGVNILHMPDNAPYGVTRLADHNVVKPADEVFAHLFKQMADVLNIWDKGRGTARISRLWCNTACGIGEKITVNLPDRSLVGTFKGIDERGYLMLDTGAGAPMAIAAGDVFFERTE